MAPRPSCESGVPHLLSPVSPNCNRPHGWSMAVFGGLFILGWCLIGWVRSGEAATPTFAAGISNGMVTTSEIIEASGIIASRQNPGVLWTHNDSSFPGSVFALSTNGALLARYFVPGVFGGDFEDISFGPGSAPDLSLCQSRRERADSLSSLLCIANSLPACRHRFVPIQQDLGVQVLCAGIRLRRSLGLLQGAHPRGPRVTSAGHDADSGTASVTLSPESMAIAGTTPC